MKIKNKKTSLIAFYSVATIFLGFIMGYFISSLFSGGELQLTMESPTPFITDSVHQVKIDPDSDFDKGERWKLFADYIKYNKDTDKGIIHNITCSYYEKEQEAITIESDKAEVDFKEETILFNDKVRVVSSEGDVLEVDRFFWDRKQNKAFGEGNVRLLKDKTLVKAEKIESDIILKSYNMFGNVEIIKSKERKNEIEEDKIIR